MTAIKSNLTTKQQSLWRVVLDKVEELKRQHPESRGSRRRVALLTSDGETVATHLELDQSDGTVLVFYIEAWTRPGLPAEVEVSRWFHNHDDMWERRLTEDMTDVAVIDGEFYRIRQEPSPRERREFPAGYGYGGRRFVVRFRDGREVVTHNLWHGGTVPPSFRDRLPDNAEFVREPQAGEQP